MHLAELLNQQIFLSHGDIVFLDPENYSTTRTEIPGVDENIELIWTWSRYLRVIIFSTIITFTILGNALVLIAVFTRTSLHSPTHFFIANLAIADFLVGILVLPFLAIFQLSETWYFGQEYCMAWVCIHFWLCSSSILSVCAICLDRYVGVSHPLKHYRYMSNKNVGIVVGMVWTIACFLSIVPVFAWPEPQDDPFDCRINQQFGHVLVASVGILYIPTLVIVILYWQIYRAAVNHLSSLRRGFKKSNDMQQGTDLRIHVGSVAADVGSSGSSSEIDSNDNNSNNCHNSSKENLTVLNYKRQTKTAKKLAIVVGAFIFSYFPFFTIFLIRSQDQSLVSMEVFNIFGWIRYFNSCLNPMIYAAMLPGFRRAFREIIVCKKR